MTNKAYQFSVTLICTIYLGLIYSIYAEQLHIPKTCQSDVQCTVGHCCILGNYRNTGPECKAKQGEGDACRPFEELITNRTHYFNNKQIELQGVHESVCPCLEGLKCDKKLGICIAD